MNTFSNLLARALTVMNERIKEMNTATRVGSLFRDILYFLQNLILGIILKGELANEAEIKAIPNPERGDTYKATDTGHYWCYDGTQWNDIGAIIPADILTKDIITQTITEETETIPSNKAIYNALSFKSSINYYFEHPIIDFESKSITFNKGYFAYGKSVFLLSEQILSYTGGDSLHICLNLTNKQWVLQSVTDTTNLPNHIYVGVIDIGNSDVRGNFREADLGNRQRIGRQGFVVGSTFKFRIDFNTTTQGWKLTTTLGYLTTANGNNIINIPSQNIEFTDNNICYVYVDPIAKTFVIYPYFQKPVRSFQNLYYLGVINPTDKNVLLNVTGLVIDGKEVKQFTKEQSEQLTDSVNQLGQSKQSFLPVTGWINKSWNADLDTGAIFVDTRCIISQNKQLKNIMVVSSTVGVINLYLLDLNFNIVRTIEKNVKQWFDNVMIEDIDYTQPLYVGFESVTGKIRTISPPDNTGNGRRINKETGAVTVSNYSYAFSLETADYTDTLLGRVKVLEDRYMPTSDDINILLAQNDVIQLQPRDYLIKTPIIMQSGKVLQGSFGKTRLILTNGCKTAITGTDITDIKLSDFEIIGTQVTYKFEMNGIIPDPSYQTVITEADALNFVYMGDEIGVMLTRCEKVVLENLKIRNITGSAIRFNRVGRDYIWGSKANNLFISNCYNGIYGENEHEYSEWTNFSVTLCMIGIYFDSGNLIWTAGHVTRCRVAMMLKVGYNHAHGICNGLEIKHNQVAGILCKDVVYGQSFQGIYVSYCNVILRDCSTIYFDNLKMGNGSVICSNAAGVTGKNVIDSLVRRADNVSVDNTGNLEIMNTIDLF